MMAKCNCNNCSTHLEFDTSNSGKAITCPSCGMETKLYVPPQRPAGPHCIHCSAPMGHALITDKNMTLQLLGVILFVFGVLLLFLFPIGTLIGIPLIIIAARIGYKKRSGWKCPRCGYFFEVK